MDIDSRIVLTGATGFLGSYVLRYVLKRGYRNVLCLHRSSSSFDLVADIRAEVKWKELDLLLTEELSELLHEGDAIIHCAATVSFDDRDTSRLYESNVKSTRNLLHAAQSAGVQKFVHISSVAAIGTVGDGLRNETHVWKHSSDSTVYSVTKFLSEQEVWRAQAEGLSTVIVNPSIILGAGRWSENTSGLLSRVSQGSRYFPGGSNGFVDVRDVARIVVTLMESHIEGERFIVNGINWSYEELMRELAILLGVNPPTRPLSLRMARVAAVISRLGSLLGASKRSWTMQAVRALEREEVFDGTKVKRSLNYEFIPMRDTLRDTVEAFNKWQSSGVWRPISFDFLSEEG